MLEQKFALGLFENPYVGVKQAARIVGYRAFVHEGRGLTHRHPMCARLPIELPSSLQAVAAQQPDVPHDSPNPLYPIHFGGC